jgi:hypothetical protein
LYRLALPSNFKAFPLECKPPGWLGPISRLRWRFSKPIERWEMKLQSPFLEGGFRQCCPVEIYRFMANPGVFGLVNSVCFFLETSMAAKNLPDIRGV